MAVYREGYSILEDIKKNSERVYNDAADVGAPVKKGEQMWSNISMLREMYGPKDEFPEDKLEERKDEFGGYFDIMLMDEWAFSDGRKTEEEATEVYRIHYMKITNPRHPSLNPDFKGVDGFAYVEQIR